MGGPSSEHEISLISGINVLKAIRAVNRFEGVPIFITKNGVWLVGQERHWMSPSEALTRVDLVFNALHGEYGEDGTVQNILDQHGLPYTGSEALPSALAMQKHASQKILEAGGVRMPRSLVLDSSNLDTRTVLAFSAPPWIIKPLARGSSVGVSKANTQAEIVDAFRKALQFDTRLLVQEFIPGREVTCGVLDGYGALAPVEIIPPEGSDFFDYTVKYNGETQEICPANFYGPMLARIRATALRVHQLLHLRHYSRTDMIVKTPDKTRGAPELYVLEANTLPGLTGESLFPKAARQAGLEFPNLISHLLDLAVI